MIATATELGPFIRTTIPAIFMPPAGLMAWILVGLATMRYRRRLGIVIATTCFALLYLLSLPVVGGLLLKSLEEKPAQRDISSPKAIIVLGADSDYSPNIPADAVPGPLSLQRLVGAAQLMRATHLPVLITGGKLRDTEAPIADLMADSFSNVFNLPVTWRETDSANTCENARFSARVLRQSGVSSAFVVTHAWHMRRAILAFRRAGFEIVPAPLEGGEAGRYSGFTDLLPRSSAWTSSYWAIHEWIGIIAYQAGACPEAPEARQMTSQAPSADVHALQPEN